MDYSVLPPEWVAALSKTAFGPNLSSLYSGVDTLFASQNNRAAEVYPNRHLVFRAFHATPPDKVRLVIVGQDPYPQKLAGMDPSDPGRSSVADGLAFSASGLTPPESLIRVLWNLWITGELSSPPKDGSLLRWAQEEGVLLLNAALTTAGSRNIVGTAPREASLRRHKQVYEELLKATLSWLVSTQQAIGFMFFGKHAERLAAPLTRFDAGRLQVLNHPSRGPWPAPAYSQTPFNDMNRHLQAPIDWSM